MCYGSMVNAGVDIGGVARGNTQLCQRQTLQKSFAGVNNGPVKVTNGNSAFLAVGERVIYKVNGTPTSFSEMMALSDSHLDHTYWLPWYNNVDLDTQLRLGNVTNQTATVRIWIGGQEKTTGCVPSPSNVTYPYVLGPGQSLRVICPGVNSGPVQIISDQNIVAAQRVIYKVNGAPTSFSEMMALPNGQLDKSYWLPWYNNVNLDSQLRFGNVGNTNATVHLLIGGVEKTSGCLPSSSPYTLGKGESLRVNCAGLNSGPVQIVSDQNIVAAERVIYRVNGRPTSFSEMMALPDHQLNTTYWLPWYDDVALDTQLRFANVSGSPAQVHVYIGAIEMMGSPFTLLKDQSTRVSFTGINNGPVKIVSDQNIVAGERLIYKVNGTPASFSEMMAVPNSQLNATFWLPWYNNIDLDTQLRLSVP
jgi:uncharacterized protein YcfL